MNGNQILLHGMESLVTSDPQTAYRVVKGTVIVFIAPFSKGALGKRLPLCEVETGRMIPSFAFRDQEYKEWRMVLVGKQEAELVEMPGSVTSILKKNFIKKAGLAHFEQEGFEGSLTDFYQRELVKDSIFFEREKKQEPQVQGASYAAIKGAFDSKEARLEGSEPAYLAVAYACRLMRQGMADLERTNRICAGDLSIPNIARASHLICRDVVLEPGWYQTDAGMIISKTEDKIVVCAPKGRNGYVLWNPETRQKSKLTKKIAETISPKAYVLERTLPERKLTYKDLASFALKSIPSGDIWAFALLALIGSLIGVLMPTLNQKIYDDYIPLGNLNQLIQICIVIGAVMLGNLFFSVVKSITELRIKSQAGYELQDAAYFRILHLPESFFRNYDSADLAARLMSIGETVNTVLQATVITGISTLFVVVYLIRMFKYSAKLSWYSLLMIVIYAAVLTLFTLKTVKYEKQSEEESGKASSRLYQFLNGIEKIRMAGVEERAAHEYLLPFSNIQFAEIRKNRLDAVTAVLNGVAMTIFSMVLYLVVVKSKANISMGAFVGFNSALGAFTGALLEQIGQLIGVYQLKPKFDRFKPILETAPEDDGEKELPGKLQGQIDLEHVSFSYRPESPKVIDDLNLHIRKGEYLGIVGASGCGKSTLLKLLLGFEAPQLGQIKYDGKNLATMDKQTFRQNLGVVLQSGKLISGSIFENITITAPQATTKEVNRVIEAVGLKDDIARMPMGIHTVLSENSGTISGGQQQRILIARAIIRNPSILFFDEATSALDNITQAMVSESLDQMHVTRVVIAHRLSTIKNCDRIIVLDRGKIREEGTYEELMALGGMFYQLASRQIS
ncbi:MAG: NHLP bacteriocin export ABC transporter permease/ATPase subunit [Firmicutes bacterium]|nr:NHLP bacteriocin export ABC transporter permease/ATPase subunit [Bacillota bacterium]